MSLSVFTVAMAVSTTSAAVLALYPQSAPADSPQLGQLSRSERSRRESGNALRALVYTNDGLFLRSGFTSARGGGYTSGDGGQDTEIGLAAGPASIFVSAGADQAIVVPEVRSLPISVDLGGLLSVPADAHARVTWSQLSGPGPADFFNRHSLRTTAGLSAAGDYRLLLTVITATGTVHSDVEIALILASSD